MLRARRKQQIIERLAAGPKWSEDLPGLVFTTSRGAIYKPRTFALHLEAAVAAAISRDDVTPKTLRHTFAVNSLLAGVSPKAVQGALGHYSASFTLDVYAHYTDELRQDAAAKMDAFISSLNNPQRVK